MLPLSAQRRIERRRDPVMTPPENVLSRRAFSAGGQPISLLMHKALADPGLISLAAGFVDQTQLPVEAMRAAFEALLSDEEAGRAALQYGTTAGYPPLRQAVLDRLRALDGAAGAETELSIDQVVMTTGSNQMLHLVADSILDPGDVVLCDAPSYFVFLGVLKNLGADAVGVAVDEDGMIPEALDDELARRSAAGELHRVKAIYIVSYFDNPRGVSLASERRAEIVEIASRWSQGRRIHVIEDAAYRQLRYDGDDLPSLRAFDPTGETVIFTDTFSKSFAPGVRVGYGILPRRLAEAVLNQKGNVDFGSANFDQQLMAKVLELNLLDAHAERLRASYRTKRDAMLAALDEHLGSVAGVEWNRPRGGLYVWLRLPEAMDAGPEGRLLDEAAGEGVLYVPGEYCYPESGIAPRRNTIRLSFGVQSCENIGRGVAALAKAVRRLM